MAALSIPEIKPDSCWCLGMVSSGSAMESIGSTESGMFSHGTHCKIPWRFDYRGGIHGTEPRMFSPWYPLQNPEQLVKSFARVLINSLTAPAFPGARLV